MDEISSPQPVFPSGHNVTQDIALLNDSEKAADPSDKTTQMPSNVSNVDADSLPVEKSLFTTENTDHCTAEANADGLGLEPLREKGTAEEEIHIMTPPSDQISAPAPEAISPTSAPADNGAVDVPAGDMPLPPLQPVQSALPLGLPPGVDLQALLNTFAATNSAPVELPSSSVPAVSDTPAIPSSQPVTPAIVKPSAPWQTTQTQQAPETIHSANSAVATPSRQASDDAAYEQFLIDEKRIMGNTAPHEFEPGSRLFVGNLSIETTSKREVYFIFRKYGKLAQVSLKSTYGFVQFLTGRECRNAMESEQGIELGGRKLHLEVSKPQTARGAAPAVSASRRRSRSPVRRSPARSFPDRRDSYEQYRGPSPPQRRASPGRYLPVYANRRSPSPRRYAPPDEIPLTPRYGSQIPEVQIVVLDESDRTYIYWVETSVRQAGLKVETLFLSPRLGLPAVVRQMAKEGVLAIVQCNRQLQMMNKVSLQVFDRSQGASNVRFDEYAGLDMATAVGLLKRTQQQAVLPPPPAPQQANLAAMIAQMDPASLQQVIGALSQQQNHQHNNPGYSGYPYRR